MKSTYKRLILYVSQLIIPGLLFYGFPNIYSRALNVNDQSSLDYQYILITFLTSWGVGSLFAGIIINRYGAYLGIIIGYLFAFIGVIVLLLERSYSILLVSSFFVGFSLAFLMLDGIIAYFEQTTANINTFRKHIIQLTFFSGFASTFTYLVISPIFIFINFNVAIIISVFIIILFFVSSQYSLTKPYNKKVIRISNISYKSLFSQNAYAVTIIMLSQGIIQTIIFFEVFIILIQTKTYHIQFVLVSYAVIGISQVIGRFIVSRYAWSSFYINFVSALLIFVGSLLYFIAAYIYLYSLPIFAIMFGLGLGISTISKPLIISDIFRDNFPFYNGFYSFILNISRIIIPLLTMLNIIAFSLLSLLCIGLILALMSLVCSYFILINNCK